MPKAMERELKAEAEKRGYGKERKGAFVFGTLRKTGWKPEREKGKGMLADYVSRKKEKK